MTVFHKPSNYLTVVSLNLKAMISEKPSKQTVILTDLAFSKIHINIYTYIFLKNSKISGSISTSSIGNPICLSMVKGSLLTRECIKGTALAKTCLPFSSHALEESNSNNISSSMWPPRAGQGSRLQAPINHGSHTCCCFIATLAYYHPRWLCHAISVLANTQNDHCARTSDVQNTRASSLPKVIRCQQVQTTDNVYSEVQIKAEARLGFWSSLALFLAGANLSIETSSSTPQGPCFPPPPSHSSLWQWLFTEHLICTHTLSLPHITQHR